MARAQRERRAAAQARPVGARHDTSSRAKPARSHLVWTCRLRRLLARQRHEGRLGLTSQTINKDVAFVRTTEGAGAVDARVRQLLSRTLSIETAVQIALLNNKG